MADLETLAREAAERIVPHLEDSPARAFRDNTRAEAQRIILAALRRAREAGRKEALKETLKELKAARSESRAQLDRALRAERAAGYDCAP